jgi:hypothetical protein
MPLEPQSQHFIFLVTSEWSQKARVFVTVKPFEQSVIQHSSLFGPFLSYEEHEVLQIQFFTTIYFFITMLSVVMLSIVMLSVAASKRVGHQ